MQLPAARTPWSWRTGCSSLHTADKRLFSSHYSAAVSLLMASGILLLVQKRIPGLQCVLRVSRQSSHLNFTLFQNYCKFILKIPLRSQLESDKANFYMSLFPIFNIHVLLHKIIFYIKKTSECLLKTPWECFSSWEVNEMHTQLL